MIEQQTTQAAQAERFSLRVRHAIMRANLKVPHKLLLDLICHHHNDARGYAWPSIERLALMAGNVDPRTIQRQLRTLQKRGLIDIKPMPGLRTNAYYLQEQAIAAIAISTITWPKNMLGHPAFACATPDTSVALPRHQSAPTPALECSYPDTGATLTEERNGKNGTEEERTCAQPSTAWHQLPPSSPALFASHLGQPEQPTAGLAKEDRSAEQHAIAQVNAQRVTNGKKPFTLADQRQLAAEAAKANISTLQAVEWILERSSRNFFRADFFVPPVQQPALQAATAPAMPKAAPVPVVLSPEEQAKLEAQAAAAKAKAMALVASWNGTNKAQKDEATTVPKHLTGPAWAVDAVSRYRAGEHVSLYAIESACSVLKINIKALRAECAKVPVTT